MILGLLGGTRVQHMRGHGVLTFHLPFIIAATALGGPVAGGWVAMVATLEKRELRDLPWYGTLSNHAALAFSAVLAGVVLDRMEHGVLAGITDQVEAAQLIAIIVATLVLSLVSAAIAAGVVVLRDGLTWREARRLYDISYRTTSASEVVLGWMLFLAYSTIGWWAALIAASLVVVIWQGYDYREIARHDAMTGLLSRAGFDARFEEILVGVRRGAGKAALLAIDLDGFSAINNRHGHQTGDEVIREVGVRLRDSIRLTDAAVRTGGDEFGVLLAGVSDGAAAETLANRILVRLLEPIETEKGIVHVGASIGAVLVEPTGRALVVDKLHAIADHEMYEVKYTPPGGGLRFYTPDRPGTAHLMSKKERLAADKRRQAREHGPLSRGPVPDPGPAQD
jgi:diguanylate cyclase (GGDEF)-like protein